MDISTIAVLVLISTNITFAYLAWAARHEWGKALKQVDDLTKHITTARGLAYDSGFARGERSMAGEMVRAAMRAMREGRDIFAAVVTIARLAEPVEAVDTIQV